LQLPPLVWLMGLLLVTDANRRLLILTTVSLVLLGPVEHRVNFLGDAGLNSLLHPWVEWYLQLIRLLCNIGGLIRVLNVDLLTD
jgi:hypothetical protein